MLPFAHRLKLLLHTIENISARTPERELVDFLTDANQPLSKKPQTSIRTVARNSVRRWLEMKWHQIPREDSLRKIGEFFEKKGAFSQNEIVRLLSQDMSLSDFLTSIKWQGQSMPDSDIVSKNITFNFAIPYFSHNNFSLFNNMSKHFYLYRMHSNRNGICRDYMELVSFNGFFGKGIIRMFSSTDEIRHYEASIFPSKEAFFIVGSSNQDSKIDTIFIIIRRGIKGELYAAIGTGLVDRRSFLASALGFVKAVDESADKQPRFIKEPATDEETSIYSDIIKVLDKRDPSHSLHKILTFSNELLVY